MGGDRGPEGVAGDWSGDAGPGGQVQGGAGVVVEPGEDLGVGGVGDPVVGEVGLPGLVGKGCLEADLGRAGPFLGRPWAVR